MNCPICHVQLVMSERHGVEIDYCPKCRGVWLDRGELDKIIEKTTGPVVLADPDPAPEPRRAAEPVREWREPYRDDRRYRDHDEGDERDEGRSYKRRKRKSILSEIFDFD